MKQIVLPIALLLCTALCAQDETVKKLQAESGKAIAKDAADTIPKRWKKGGLVSLAFAQGTLSNWAAGGDEFTMSLNSLISLYAFWKENKHSWDNTFDFSFGHVKTTSLGSRKNDDRIDLLSKYGYAIAPKWNVAGLFNFRSQVANGYTYPDGVKTFTSAFLSPAYILLSPGIDYKPNQNFSVFVSPATARWTIVRDDTLSAKGMYGVAPGSKSEMEFGAFLTANYLKDINRVLSYKGRLDLFSNYKRNPKNVDLFMTNIFSAKLSRWLSASWNLDLIYDDDVRLFGERGTSPGLQVKSLIGVGVMAKF